MMTKSERAHCNGCGGETLHTILVERQQPGSEDISGDGSLSISWLTTWAMLECAGCLTVCMRRSYWFSETDEVSVEFFPPPIARKPPSWLPALSDGVGTLLTQLYVALNAGSLRLAMIGARSLIDDAVQAKIGDAGGFERKLDIMLEQQLISEPQKQRLLAAVETGNAAIHRGHSPSFEDAELVMDIVEGMLRDELLSERAADLYERTPKRNPPRS